MEFKKIKKNNILFITICSFVVVFLVNVLYFSFAFVDYNEVSNTLLDFGLLDLSENDFKEVFKENIYVIPGTSILSKNAEFTVSSDSDSMYIRAIFSINPDDTSADLNAYYAFKYGMNDLIESLDVITTGNAGFVWVRNGDYYYLCNTSFVPVAINSTYGTIMFLDASELIFPTTINNESINDDSSTVSIRIVVEGIQSYDVNMPAIDVIESMYFEGVPNTTFSIAIYDIYNNLYASLTDVDYGYNASDLISGIVTEDGETLYVNSKSDMTGAFFTESSLSVITDDLVLYYTIE